MNEFLQTEEYYSRFLQAKETLASWARGAMAVIEGENCTCHPLRLRSSQHIEGDVHLLMSDVQHVGDN